MATPVMTHPHRAARISARIAAEKKELMERAAAIRGVSLTNFLIDSAYDRAVDTVRAHESWVLNEGQSAFVVDLLLNPPAPTEEMRHALAHYFATRTTD